MVMDDQTINALGLLALGLLWSVVVWVVVLDE